MIGFSMKNLMVDTKNGRKSIFEFEIGKPIIIIEDGSENMKDIGHIVGFSRKKTQNDTDELCILASTSQELNPISVSFKDIYI